MDSIKANRVLVIHDLSLRPSSWTARVARFTDLMEFEDRGHSLTMDHGWAEVADARLSKLDTNAVQVVRFTGCGRSGVRRAG